MLLGAWPLCQGEEDNDCSSPSNGREDVVGQAIRQPRDLTLPSEIWPMLKDHFKTDEVRQHLNPKGARIFQLEVLEALHQSIDTNDLRPVQEVLEAWYRTLIVLKDPGFARSYNWALKHPPNKKSGRDVKHLRHELGF